MKPAHKDDVEVVLLASLKTSLPELEKLFESISSHWIYEDFVYRYYHQSFKVYSLQACTEKIVTALSDLVPGRSLNKRFLEIYKAGTGKKFSRDHNQRWGEETRPILEAFFHSKYFLEMAIKYGKVLESPPRVLPSGWAALLYLYDAR